MGDKVHVKQKIVWAGPAPRFELPKPVPILVDPLLFNIKKNKKKTLYIYCQF
jgi:hypothetical protein